MREPPKSAHNDCHQKHHSLSGTETEGEPDTFHHGPQDSGQSVDQAEPLQVEEDKILGDVNVPDSHEVQEEERSPSVESSRGERDEPLSQTLRRRSSRLKKPVVRPRGGQKKKL